MEYSQGLPVDNLLLGIPGPLDREESVGGPLNHTVPIPPHLAGLSANETDASEEVVEPKDPLACLSSLMLEGDPTQIFVSNADLTSCVSTVYRPDPDTGMNTYTTSLQEIADCLNAMFDC